MSWIQDALKQRFQSSVQVAVEPKPFQATPGVPASKRDWAKLAEILADDIAEFNSSVGTAHRVRRNDLLIEILSSPGIDTVVFTKDDPNANSFHVVCTISRPGIPRHGDFRLNNGHVVSTGNFVGEPEPGTLPMTLEKFSEFILKPYLFPVR